jgi:hypothetical protein
MAANEWKGDMPRMKARVLGTLGLLGVIGCGSSDGLFPRSSGSGSHAVPDAAALADSGTGGASGDATIEQGGTRNNGGSPSANGGADVREVPDGAPVVNGRDSGSSTRDSGADAASDICAHRTPWYADGDADGYGNAAAVVVACARPTGGRWVAVAGDCDDHDARVHPGQVSYFGTPYTSAGAVSFDYDCSGQEDADPLQSPAPASCGLLSLTLCGGSGYTPTARTGQNVNPLCGSTSKNTCQAAVAVLLCETVTETATEPFRCK